MRLNYLKQSAVDELRHAIGQNIKQYSQPRPWLADFFNGRNFLAESKFEIEALPALLTAGKADKELYEYENTVVLHAALRDLTPSQAADERLWAWLAHDVYWDYMRSRWPVETASNHKAFILDHYFVGGARGLVRHGLARLWWFGYATYQANAENPYHLTQLLLKTTDARQSIMERQFWRNKDVLVAILDRVGYWQTRGLDFYSPRERFRRLCKTFNLYGGTMLLDTLSSNDLHALIDELASLEISQTASS